MDRYRPQSGIRVVWDEGVEARASFIQKTYAHLFAAIILFVAFEILLFKSGVAARIAAPMAGRWYLVLGGFMLVSWFSVGMVALAGAAILYDTSNVLHRYPHDRYVGASLALFASVALMFWFVLRIFISRD